MYSIYYIIILGISRVNSCRKHFMQEFLHLMQQPLCFKKISVKCKLYNHVMYGYMAGKRRTFSVFWKLSIWRYLYE